MNSQIQLEQISRWINWRKHNNINTYIMLIKCATLVDITKTNVTRNAKPQGSSLTQLEWDFFRNQQRNWDVIIQLLGLRFQPEEITTPVKVTYNILNTSFGSDYVIYNAVSVWEFSVSFHANFDISLLHTDFNNIPIISGLTESVKFNKACIFTDGNYKNFSILL